MAMRGHQRSREHVRSQHREHHRFRQRHEQELRHAGQKKHRHEHDADAKSGNERRHGDLLRAIQNGADGFFALRQIAVDVFDFHRGVVHQDPDGQRQAAKRHDVDGFAQRAEHADGNENGKRNGNGDDQRAAPVSKEKQNHQRSEAGGDQRFTDHALHRRAHENGLVEHLR